MKRPMAYGGRKPLQEAYTRRERVIDACVGLLCWLALSGLAAWLHHVSSYAGGLR